MKYIFLIFLLFISCESDIPGCTYSSACNYNSVATTDDGSCIYPPVGSDCSYYIIDTDGDGVPNYQEIGGCTDFNACNYDISATEDDATCWYVDSWNDCDGFIDHCLPYIGLWEFHVERYYETISGSGVDPENGNASGNMSYVNYVDSIKSGSEYFRLNIPFAQFIVPYVYDITSWEATINEYGELRNFSLEDEGIWSIEWGPVTPSGIWSDDSFGFFNYYSSTDLEAQWYNNFNSIYTNSFTNPEQNMSNYFDVEEVEFDNLLYIHLRRTFSTETPLQGNDWNLVHQYRYYIYAKKIN